MDEKDIGEERLSGCNTYWSNEATKMKTKMLLS